MNIEGERLSRLAREEREAFNWDLIVARSKTWRPYAAVIFAFWGIWYVFYTAYGFINATDEAPALILPRSLIAIAPAHHAKIVFPFARRRMSNRRSRLRSEAT